MKLSVIFKHKVLSTIIFFLLMPGWCTFTLSKDQTKSMINILIKEPCTHVTVRCENWLQITCDTEKSLRLFGSEYETPIIIEPYGSGIKVNELEIQSTIIHLNSMAKSPIQIDALSYRGEIIIHLDSQWKLKVINRLDLNSYLFGIMKSEISPDWPSEILKAQAIIARTYALREVSLQKYDGYNIKASIDSQVYIGITGEDPRTNRAIQDTEGLILTLEGEIFPAFYHACCGGITESAKNIFGDYPAVIGITCGHCDNSPHFDWQISITPIELRNILLRNGYRVAPIEKIQILKRYPSGRIDQLALKNHPIHTSSSRLLMKGKEFRKLLGYNFLRGTDFTVSFEDEQFVFQGKGWGHGIGLCQWGAKGMGDMGANYKEILNKYYPLAEITFIESH